MKDKLFQRIESAVQEWYKKTFNQPDCEHYFKIGKWITLESDVIQVKLDFDYMDYWTQIDEDEPQYCATPEFLEYFYANYDVFENRHGRLELIEATERNTQAFKRLVQETFATARIGSQEVKAIAGEKRFAIKGITFDFDYSDVLGVEHV